MTVETLQTPETVNVPNKVQAGMSKAVTEDKATVIAMLRAEGMTTKAIAQALGLSTSAVYKTDDYLRKTQKTPLLSPKRVKNAVRVLDTFMAGKPIGRIEEIDPETGDKKVIEPGIYPKCSTIKACADSVLDREYPKAQEEAGKGNISFTQINISLASETAHNPPIDISPDPEALPNDNYGQ